MEEGGVSPRNEPFPEGTKVMITFKPPAIRPGINIRRFEIGDIFEAGHAIFDLEADTVYAIPGGLWHQNIGEFLYEDMKYETYWPCIWMRPIDEDDRDSLIREIEEEKRAGFVRQRVDA